MNWRVRVLRDDMSREDGLTRVPRRVEEPKVPARAGSAARRRRMAMGRTTVTRNEVHGGEEARRGRRKGASPFSGTISSLASTKAF